ncbi:MAG TPA: prolyl oligopeptidase family serine peptidase, partial [Elusimicrobiales bacterium]|nr:prolyl oligopeptidase family serine peptidase [Elusimicrobiales bacterium]
LDAGEHQQPQPLLDLDALNASEKENWVWKGAQILKAGGYKHALITLSRGGADAAVTREYDIAKREFIKDGFFIPEAKGSAAWIDENSIYVATDFGPGSMTASGYPRMVKRWRRGVPLEKAELVYEGLPTDMSVGAVYDDTEGFERGFVVRSLAFYRTEKFLVGKDGKLIRLDAPIDSETDVAREWLTVQLRSSWTVESGTYPPGALLAARFDDFLAGKRRFEALYLPARNSSLASYAWTRNHLVLNTLEDVKNRLFALTPGGDGWKREELRGAPEFSAVSFRPVDPEDSDEYFMEAGGFLAPPALYLGRIGELPEKLKEMPAFFDASGLEVGQHFARSKDGTLVPYFQVSPKNIELDGANPTLLSGYGGFEISQTPYYSGAVGLGWLAKGGVYVVANIRGGGEYGPAWHQAALKSNRHRAYEDFAAVASDLIERKVTSPARLGCRGGSNGGLLAGNMLTLYP